MIITSYPGIEKSTLTNTKQNVIDSENDRYLFKAKRLDDGDWLIGYVIKYGYTGKEKYYIVPSYASDLYAIEVDPSTICQCTGLKDKNGKLIWENDIIHKLFYTDYDAYANSEAYTGRIQYEDGGWSVEITKSDGGVCISPIIDMIAYSKDIEHFEVIGNIFDNPELLESEEKQ